MSRDGPASPTPHPINAIRPITAQPGVNENARMSASTDDDKNANPTILSSFLLSPVRNPPIATPAAPPIRYAVKEDVPAVSEKPNKSRIRLGAKFCSAARTSVDRKKKLNAN